MESNPNCAHFSNGENQKIHAFIEKLAHQNVFENTTNQFSYNVASNEIRLNNLIHYL